MPHPLPVEVARAYAERGWVAVPIPRRSKNPGRAGWTSERNVPPEHFEGKNIGIHLGPSNLIDLDLDCPEAIALAPDVLPPTATFGRASKPRSHWVYQGQARYRKFVDPLDGACILEIRSGEGKQSVFPGSTHESGEPIEWHSEQISDADPCDAAARLAVLSWCRKHGTDDVHPRVAAWLGATPEPGEHSESAPTVFYAGPADPELARLIAQHYPGLGSRHDYRMACAGAMWRAGVARDAAEATLLAATEAVGGKVADVRPVIEATWSGERPNTGSATLIEQWSAKAVADRIDALTTPDVRVITWLERLDEVCTGGKLDVFEDSEILNGLARMHLGKDSRLPALWARLKDFRYSHLRELREAVEHRAREIGRQQKREKKTPLALALSEKGNPLATIDNCALLIEHFFGDLLRFEEHAGRIVCGDIDPALGNFPAGDWTDVHTTELVRLCEREGLLISPASADRAIAAHAHKHAHNVLSDFLAECADRWDGMPRVDRALVTYWGAEDAPATHATSRVLMLSLAARGLKPGCKVDTCPILYGPQGILKSSSLKTLVGEAWFSDSPINMGDKDSFQNLRGVWLWEIAEHAGISRREAEQVKAFLSSSEDHYRASYGRHTVTVPRQTCFVSTTNTPEVLTDATGSRRFLPVTVGTADVDALARDRVQLLGEAARRVLDGEQWWTTPEEEAAVEAVRGGFQAVDPWEGIVDTWLETQVEPFEIYELLRGALCLTDAQINKPAEIRAAGILRKLGYERTRCKSRGPNRDRRLWTRRK
jgi:hypothetical protein